MHDARGHAVLEVQSAYRVRQTYSTCHKVELMYMYIHAPFLNAMLFD